MQKKMQPGFRDDKNPIGIVLLQQQSDTDEDNDFQLQRQYSSPQYSTNIAAPQQQSKSPNLECVGENWVQRGGLHKKSMSTGSMIQSNPEILQLLSQFRLCSSPQGSEKTGAGHRRRRMQDVQECDEEQEQNDEEYSVSEADTDGVDTMSDSCCSQCSSSTGTSSSARNSPSGDAASGRGQELGVPGQYERLRSVLNTLRSNSSTPATVEEGGAASPVPSTHQRQPSFDVTQLRLNLTKLEHQASASSLDAAVDQLMAMSVGYALWTSTSASPTPRKSQSPSPDQTMDRSDHRWIQPLPGDTDKDALIHQAYEYIAKLKHRQITTSVEKDLLEKEMHFWRSRVTELESRLMEVEETAADKTEMVEQLETQLQLCRFYPQLQTQSQACSVRYETEHNVPCVSDISVSLQSGTSSLLKTWQHGVDDVKQLYPPLETEAIEELLHTKKPLHPPATPRLTPPSSVPRPPHTMPVRYYLLNMLWSGHRESVRGFSLKLVEAVKKVMFEEKYRPFWDWLWVVVFPLLGYAGVSVYVTLLLAAVALAWRKLLCWKVIRFFDEGGKQQQ